MSTQNTTVTVDGWPLLNPFSSSVFLSPEMAHEMQIARYILVGASGVSFSLRWVSGKANEHQAFVWDFLYNIRNDFIFASRQGRWGLPTIVYFLSKYSRLFFFCFVLVFRLNPSFHRLSSLGFVIFSAVFQSQSKYLYISPYAKLWLASSGAYFRLLPWGKGFISVIFRGRSIHYPPFPLSSLCRIRYEPIRHSFFWSVMAGCSGWMPHHNPRTYWCKHWTNLVLPYWGASGLCSVWCHYSPD